MFDHKFPVALRAALLAVTALLTMPSAFSQDAPAPAAAPVQNAGSARMAGNPLPLEKFSGFQHYELLPLSLASGVKGDAVIARLQEVINERVKPNIDGWNAKAGPDTTGRTLVIQPRIDSLKFSTVGKRIFAGPFAGSSHVNLSARFYDKATGVDVANPKFFTDVGTMSGVFGMGGQDIAMLYRAATLFSDYNQANY